MKKGLFASGAPVLIATALSVTVFTAATCSEQPGAKPGPKAAATASKPAPVIEQINGVDHINQIVTSAGDQLLAFDLYADWCGPCRILSPILEQIGKEQGNRVKIYKIDVDKHPDIAQAFFVAGIPYVVFIKNRTVVQAVTGVQPKATYVQIINQHAAQDQTTGEQPSDADGVLRDGVRVIDLLAGSGIGKLHVYRGETVRLQIKASDQPFEISIPQLDITRTGTPGSDLSVDFKAEKIGVYPIFCNGSCPSGDGSNVGHIIVMQYTGAPGGKYHEVSIAEARALIDKEKPLIVDVRTPNEFFSGHIDQARLIPLAQFSQRISELEAYKNKPVLLYCRSGNRSTVAAQLLIENGFRTVYNLRDGTIGWKKEGQKLVKQQSNPN